MKRETRERSHRSGQEEEKYVEESEFEQEDEGETRCICGRIEPPDDSGLYIQCEECHVWQHGCCVGITEEDTPDKYWCEQCKPDLHSLYSTDIGEKRSIYKPIQQRRRKHRKAKRNSESESEGSADAQSPASSGLNGSVGTQRVSRQRRNSGNVEGSYKKEEGEENLPSGATVEEKEVGEPGDELDEFEENQKHTDRKRATSSAREEKHYQLMLEKALRESRRSSKDGPEEQDGSDHLKDETSTGKTPSPKLSSRDTESLEVNEWETEDSNSQSRKRGRAATKSTSPSESEEDSKSKRSRRGKTASSSQSNSRNSKAGGRGSRGGRSNGSKASGSSGSSNSSKSNGSTTSEIGINKPLKPRIPSQRTTIHEMRRRVNAILEFISRTQLELSEDQLQKEQLCQFVENEEFLGNINKIFSNYDESLKSMDDLTRKLLLWEQKFSTLH